MGTQSWTYHYNEDAQWATKFSFQLEGYIIFSKVGEWPRFNFETSPTAIQTVNVIKPATGNTTTVTARYNGTFKCQSTQNYIKATCEVKFDLWRGRTPIIGTYRATLVSPTSGLACTVQPSYPQEQNLRIRYIEAQDSTSGLVPFIPGSISGYLRPL